MLNEYIITLVHGTFAKNAPWVQKDSPFRRKMLVELNRLGGQKIEFVEFDWSGKNSNIGRIEASKELAIILENQSLHYPNRKKIIIAHSHGGNVALYALKNLQEQHNFNLITLSTPFLHVKEKEFIDNLEQNIKIIHFFFNCLIAVVFLGLFSLLAYLFSDTVAIIFGLIGAITIPFSVLLLDNIYMNMNDNILSRVGNGIDETIEYMSYQKVSELPNVLVLVHRLDEVRLWFNSIKKVWAAIFSLDLLLGYGKLVAFGGIGINFFLILICFCFPAISGPLITYLIRIDIIFLLIIFGSPFYSLMTLILLLISKSNRITLGMQPWYETLFIEIKPSHKLVEGDQILCKEYTHKMASALNHSLYEDEIIISDICAWIISKC